MATFNIGLLAFAFVILAACSEVLGSKHKSNVRLVNGDETVHHEGFVEFYSHGVWRKISNVRWDYRNDLVICKQLGFADVSKKPDK